MGGSYSTSRKDTKLGFDPNYRQSASPNVKRPILVGDTVLDRFIKTVEIYGEDTFMQFKREYASKDGQWESLSYNAFLTLVTEYASALKAAGLAPNEKVILTGETSGEYVLSALAVLMAGGVVVGVHTGFLPLQILTIINHIKPAIVIGEREVLASVLHEAELKKSQSPNANNSLSNSGKTSPRLKRSPRKEGTSPRRSPSPRDSQFGSPTTNASSTSTSNTDLRQSPERRHHRRESRDEAETVRHASPTGSKHDTHFVEHHQHHHRREELFEVACELKHQEHLNNYSYETSCTIIALDRVTGDNLLNPHQHWTDFIKAKATSKVAKDVLVHRQPTDEASIFFTSGTTGFPKGVIHTHGSIVGSCDQYTLGYSDVPRGRALVMHFPASQLIQTGFLSFAAGGMSFALHPLVDKSLLQFIQPNFLFSNPFSLNQGVKEVYTQLGNQSTIVRKAGKGALRRAMDHAAKELEGNRYQEAPRKFQLSGTDAKVIKKIKGALGNEISAIWVSMAKSDPTVNQFFWGLGVGIYDCYGSTEMNVVCGNNNSAINLATIGKPFPGVDLRLDPATGEILVHSASLFKGYFVIQPDPEKPDPDALAFVHIGEGDKTRKYYKTGDVGQVDDDGFVRIVDRMSHRIKLASCELLSPQKVENTLAKSHLIQQVCVFGDEKEYLVAVIKPNMQITVQNGYTKNEIIDLIQADIQDFKNKDSTLGLMPYETPRKFILIHEPFTRENGMINVGDKIVRNAVYKHYQEDIDFLFTEKGISCWQGHTHHKISMDDLSKSDTITSQNQVLTSQIIQSLQTLNEKDLDLIAEHIAAIKKRNEI